MTARCVVSSAAWAFAGQDEGWEVPDEAKAVLDQAISVVKGQVNAG